MTSRETQFKRRPSVGGPPYLWVRVGLLVLGVWLSVAPFALEYRESGVPGRATVNDALVGVLVVALALLSLLAPASPGRRR